MTQKIVIFALSLFDFFYQKKIFKFLKKKNLNNLNLFLDVGAHKGESISLFLKNINIKKIISFEASPINFEYLKNNKNTFLNKYKNTEIEIENIALGSSNKKTMFKQFNESSSSTINEIDEESKYYKKKFRLLNFFGKKNVYKTFQINIEKLSDYLEKHKINKVDFLKIDTEGYEYEILLGLGYKINCVKTIMFEHHYDNMIKKNYTFSDINKTLIKNNFKLIYKSKMPFRKTFEYIFKKREQ